MFRSEGAERSDRLNRRVAGYLALVGGYVNACGVVLLGLFTAHVTGNVGRAALDAAAGDFGAALTAMALVVTFYFGALGAHLVLDSPRFGRFVSQRYSATLAIEALLLAGFAASPTHAWLLCGAMGLQNSLVTRLSGAIVRTTHLTGVVTDLGIETARWIRYWRHKIIERPPAAKIGLLGTIAGTFTLGALAGSTLALELGRLAVMVPVSALLAGAVYARRSIMRE